MSGPIHSWIFRTSLVRGARPLLGLGVLALAALAFAPRAIPAAVALAISPPVATGPELTSETVAWPRTALHLWFLVPQLLPRHDH